MLEVLLFLLVSIVSTIIIAPIIAIVAYYIIGVHLPNFFRRMSE